MKISRWQWLPFWRWRIIGTVESADEVPERLAMAEAGGAETIDFSKTAVYDELMKRTDKRGPDSFSEKLIS